MDDYYWGSEKLLEDWDMERQWFKTPEEKVEDAAYMVCHTLDRICNLLGAARGGEVD